jgi:predicted glutamine amidotransferase
MGDSIALEDIVVKPKHSLLTQSHDATEAKLAVNGDGFGFSWYGNGEDLGLFRDVLPAWSDGNLPSLCRMIRSRLFLAHVRASTCAETARVNCHPFTHGRWTFMHNGQLGNFQSIRRSLEASLPDHLYLKRMGSTDSELIFLMLLAEGLESDATGAIARVLQRLNDVRSHGDAPARMTCVLSDGRRLIAFRHATDRKAPTLYTKTEEGVGRCGQVLASEPLDGLNAGWKPIPQDRIAIFGAGGAEFLPLKDLAAA